MPASAAISKIQIVYAQVSSRRLAFIQQGPCVIEWKCDKCDYLHGRERLRVCPECGNPSATTQNRLRRRFPLICILLSLSFAVSAALGKLGAFGEPLSDLGAILILLSVLLMVIASIVLALKYNKQKQMLWFLMLYITILCFMIGAAYTLTIFVRFLFRFH